MAEKRELVEKCKDRSDRANTVVIKMISVKYSDGIHHCGAKEYCSNGERKERESFTKRFGTEEDLCLCDILQEELARFVPDTSTGACRGV